MRESYFELDDDVCLGGRWHLMDLFDRTGTKLDIRDFRYGRPVDVGSHVKVHVWNSEEIVDAEPPLRLTLHTEGVPLDLTFTEGSLVVTSKVADILQRVAGLDIQRIPVFVEWREEEYAIINVTSVVRCVDRGASRIEWYTEADGRPDMIGRAKTVGKLVVDPSRVGNANMFRLGERPIQIIVSSVVRGALEKDRVSGVRFRPVS